MKRTVALVLTVIMGLAVLTGCVFQKDHTDDPSSEFFEDTVPYDAQLVIECVDEKLVFSRIATAPKASVGTPPFNSACTRIYEDGSEIVSMLFRIMDGKETVDAMSRDSESRISLLLQLYGQDEEEQLQYLFAFCQNGLTGVFKDYVFRDGNFVQVSDAGELICSVQLSAEELQEFLRLAY